jgi:hypothetical protein
MKETGDDDEANAAALRDEPDEKGGKESGFRYVGDE